MEKETWNVMKPYRTDETTRCVVCRAKSRGRIATGHVKTASGEEILATFCSDACASKSSDKPGYFGPWQAWMGRTPEAEADAD